MVGNHHTPITPKWKFLFHSRNLRYGGSEQNFQDCDHFHWRHLQGHTSKLLDLRVHGFHVVILMHESIKIQTSRTSGGIGQTKPIQIWFECGCIVQIAASRPLSWIEHMVRLHHEISHHRHWSQCSKRPLWDKSCYALAL